MKWLPLLMLASSVVFHRSNAFKSHVRDVRAFAGRSRSASPQLEEEIDPGEVAGFRILKYPNPKLRFPNEEITSFDDDLKKLSRSMLELMYAAQGVGLAAPQIGVNKRLMVYNELGDPKKWLGEMVLVNPKIVEKSSKQEVDTEGCLSFPGMPVKSSRLVKRSSWIKVEAMNLKGKAFKKKFVGLEARIFQHEYDHLEGVVYIDHLSQEDKAEIQPRLDQLIVDHGPGAVL
jgi:peptide deformylase